MKDCVRFFYSLVDMAWRSVLPLSTQHIEFKWILERSVHYSYLYQQKKSCEKSFM